MGPQDTGTPGWPEFWAQGKARLGLLKGPEPQLSSLCVGKLFEV